MNTTPTQRRASFDRVARIYRWAEYLALGPLLSRTRRQFLREICGARRALVLGDGDGRFLAALLRQAPSLQALALDSSPAMLRLLQRRCVFAGDRLHTRIVDVTDLPPDLDLAGIDLVVTHFLLDCLPQPAVDALAQRLAHGLPRGALWVISEFGQPSRQPWRSMGALYVRALYLAFGVLTALPVHRLPVIASSLEVAGFRRIDRVERLKGLLYSELWRSEVP